jgi:hypothetical protein
MPEFSISRFRPLAPRCQGIDHGVIGESPKRRTTLTYINKKIQKKKKHVLVQYPFVEKALSAPQRVSFARDSAQSPAPCDRSSNYGSNTPRYAPTNHD